LTESSGSCSEHERIKLQLL